MGKQRLWWVEERASDAPEPAGGEGHASRPGAARRAVSCGVLLAMDFDDGTVFDKEQVVVILQNAVEEILKDQPYDHSRIGQWINDICERCTKELVGLGKPFKYVMTAVIMQRNGAGLHTVSSCFWDNANDGSASYKYDNKAMYCVATCYALAI